MAVSVVCFLYSRAAQPEAQGLTLLGDGFLYWILSATFMDPNSIGGPEPLRSGVAFLTTSFLLTPSPTVWLLSWLSYIIVQRPHCRLLDLWNRMFDRHQAGITVMQFTGHSLPVHQPMSVPWKFFFTSSHFISQFPPTLFPLITAIRMCHFLPVHHLEWHFWPGRRSKYNTTILPIGGGRVIGFILFRGVLVLCEMPSVSFRIWTRVAVSTSYDDSHYTTGTW